MIIVDEPFLGASLHFKKWLPKDLLFFDIETTGFVADKSYLYLIGCCYCKNDSWRYIQWFGESPAEERLLLTSFFEFMKHYKVLIHFNGNTFDLPYLMKKCQLNELTYHFHDIISIDLYKLANNYKHLLQFDRCNQKSIEKFFHIKREDLYSGGDLIQIYANYVGIAQLEKLQKGRLGREQITAYNDSSPSSNELLQVLLLHNKEDLLGLQSIAKLLYYDEFFDGDFKIEQMNLDENNRICFDLSLINKLPLPFFTSEQDIVITANESNCMIKIPLFEGTLKYYMEDYKNYYYLPLEDSIILKSIAGSMDKEYRKNATKDTCYLKKTSLFLPQFTNLYTPEFKKDRKDKISYFECSDERLQDQNHIHDYLSHIMNSIVFPKKKRLNTPI